MIDHDLVSDDLGVSPPPLPSLPPLPLSVATAYLDQQQWVRLARDVQHGNDETPGRLDCATRDGLLVTPLSSGHYSETWHRGDWTSRWSMARLMWRHSRLVTLAPVHQLVRQEAAHALRNLGLDIIETPLTPAFGIGVNHAFASPTGRLTLHETVSEDGQHGREMALDELPNEQTLMYQAGERLYEWFSLAGLPEDMHMDGLDLKTHRRAGQVFIDFEKALSKRLGMVPRSDHRRYIVAADSHTFWRHCFSLLEESGYGPPEESAYLIRGGPTDPLDLLLSMPTYGLFQELRVRRHSNSAHRWEPNDRIDLLALAVAAVHCNVVITERHWAHELTQIARHRPLAAATHKLTDGLESVGC